MTTKSKASQARLRGPVETISRPSRARVSVTFRCGTDGLARCDAMAELAGVDRSEMLRKLLSLGLQHYKPSRPSKP